MPKGGVAEIEGRIPGFSNRWSAQQSEIIGREDNLRWTSLDRSFAEKEKAGKLRGEGVNLPRAHSSIGAYPGCRRNVELSPRKSASMCFLEQKLLRSSASCPGRPTTGDRLYTGVTKEEQGRHEYLKRRTRYDIHDRYGRHHEALPTTSMTYGFKKSPGEYRASKYCHKPIIENGFYRTNGTQTHIGLPSAKPR